MIKSSLNKILWFKSLRLIFCLLTVLLVSCSNISAKLIYKTTVDRVTIRFYERKQMNKNKASFFARVDSNNIHITYKFLSQSTYKLYDKQDNYIHTLVYDKNPTLHFSRIDSALLIKADQLMDSLNIKQLRRTRLSTGFVVEIAGH